METDIHLSLSQTITSSFNSIQATQTKLGACMYELLATHTKLERTENIRKINKRGKVGRPVTLRGWPAYSE